MFKSLLLIFQTFINKGCYPTSGSEISSIYKANDKADIKQYRPNSILVDVSEVFERVLLNYLYPEIKRELDYRQYSFRDKCSAVVQLVYLSEVYQNCHKAEAAQIFVLYIHFKRAFDKVAHSKLIDKLQAFGKGEVDC